MGGKEIRTRAAFSLLFTFILGLSCGEARAQTPFCSSVAPLQFPFWNDADGWAKPEQYETIQLADIDGDGQDELIGRDSDGLTVQHWDDSARTWTFMLDPAAFPVDFSDAAGWNQPARYQSISFIDIDGDGKAELVAIDANNQLLVLTYDASLGAFRSVRATSPQVLGPQTRLVRLGKSQPVVVITPSSPTNPNIFTRVGFRTLTANQLGSASEATFTVGPPGVLTGDLLGNRSYQASNKQGWFYSVLGGNLDGSGTATVAYPTTSSVLNLLKFSPTGGLASSQSFHRPEDTLLLALPADLRGNGRYDLVISDPEGLTPYRWEPGNNLTALGESLSQFSYQGANPGNAPLKFSSLQIASLRDGKGDVALAMLQDGLYAWGFNENTRTWEERTRYTGISENAGYGNYASVGTLQTGTVRVNGSYRTIVIARSRLGLRTAWYLPGQGFQESGTQYFPSYIGGELTAYRYISAQTGFSDDDIRAHYTNDYASIAEIRAKIAAITAPPAGVPQGQFDYVRSQLLAEADAVDTTRRFFDRTDAFTSSLYQDQRAYLDTLIRLLSLKSSDPTKTNIDTAFKAISLVLDFISFADPTGAAKTAFGTVKAFNSIASNVLWAADTYGKIKGSGSLDATVYGLSQKILDDQRSARQVNDCGRSRFLQNWGLMKTLSDGVKSRKIAYDSAQTAALQRVYEKTFELELWQTLAPTKWVLQPTYINPGYPLEYGYSRYKDLITTYLIIIVPDQATTIFNLVPVATTTLDALFKGGYGVRKSDLFFGRNGWDLPITSERNSADNFRRTLSQVAQEDSAVFSPLTYDPTGASVSAAEDNAGPLLQASVGQPDVATTADEQETTQQEATTTDPATPPLRVEAARTQIKQLIDDVKDSVPDQAQREYETGLLTSVLGFVKNEEHNGIASDNAVALLEEYQLVLEPSVEDESPDPAAQRHMAETSSILNLLSVVDQLDNAPLHHGAP